MQFKQFTLDPFQEDAIHAIERNSSVMVSAATGTGKTLIADYVIDKYLAEHKRIIYTAPIKALSNQKYKDFKKEYGDENVGILTGDVTINSSASLLIMTTEIYRNMLLARDPLIDELSYIVFDEIHFMNDRERGTVWEESIIFSPKHVRFLFLSATVPNAEEFASWVQDTKGHKVETVLYEKRAVPLEHYVYDTEAGLTTADKLKKIMSIPLFDDVRPKRSRGGRGGRAGRGGRGEDSSYKAPTPRDVIEVMHDKLPAIIFSFSRKACEDNAVSLAQRKDFVKDPQDRTEIVQTYRKYFTPEINRMRTTSKLRSALSKGIGFHHAGLLPQHKECVEELFAKGLLQCLFATETFSVGINMPAKTVIFNGLKKFDGVSFRTINSKEYFQLAGRAGRRGIDTVGYVVAIINRKDKNFDEFLKSSAKDTDPIRSQFQLSFNTTLNLINNHSESEIKKILQSNFDYYIKRQSSEKQVRIMASFNNKKKVLKRMGFVDQQDRLTQKGHFARFIYFEELLISELFTTNLYKRLTDVELLQIIAAIIYEQRSKDYFSFKGIQKSYIQLQKKLYKNDYVTKKINMISLKRMMAITQSWAQDGDFEELMKLSNLLEGDIIRLFRRIIDMMGQVYRATSDYELKERLERAQSLIDKGLVAVEF